MSTDIRVGDTVKVTFEAEVVKASSRELCLDSKVMSTVWLDRDKVDVEKIEPPVEVFGPGDVVRSKTTGTVRTLGYGGWVNHATGNWYSDKNSRFTSEEYERVDLS